MLVSGEFVTKPDFSRQPHRDPEDEAAPRTASGRERHRRSCPRAIHRAEGRARRRLHRRSPSIPSRSEYRKLDGGLSHRRFAAPTWGCFRWRLAVQNLGCTAGPSPELEKRHGEQFTGLFSSNPQNLHTWAIRLVTGNRLVSSVFTSPHTARRHLPGAPLHLTPALCCALRQHPSTWDGRAMSNAASEPSTGDLAASAGGLPRQRSDHRPERPSDLFRPHHDDHGQHLRRHLRWPAMAGITASRAGASAVPISWAICFVGVWLPPACFNGLSQAADLLGGIAYAAAGFGDFVGTGLSAWGWVSATSRVERVVRHPAVLGAGVLLPSGLKAATTCR